MKNFETTWTWKMKPMDDLVMCHIETEKPWAAEKCSVPSSMDHKDPVPFE